MPIAYSAHTKRPFKHLNHIIGLLVELISQMKIRNNLIAILELFNDLDSANGVCQVNMIQYN